VRSSNLDSVLGRKFVSINFVWTRQNCIPSSVVCFVRVLAVSFAERITT